MKSEHKILSNKRMFFGYKNQITQNNIYNYNQNDSFSSSDSQYQNQQKDIEHLSRSNIQKILTMHAQIKEYQRVIKILQSKIKGEEKIGQQLLKCIIQLKQENASLVKSFNEIKINNQKNKRKKLSLSEHLNPQSTVFKDNCLKQFSKQSSSSKTSFDYFFNQKSSLFKNEQEENNYIYKQLGQQSSVKKIKTISVHLSKNNTKKQRQRKHRIFNQNSQQKSDLMTILKNKVKTYKVSDQLLITQKKKPFSKPQIFIKKCSNDLHQNINQNTSIKKFSSLQLLRKKQNTISKLKRNTNMSFATLNKKMIKIDIQQLQNNNI